nr:hypothetical protein [uncultured Ruegeria sp.]
MQIVSRVVLCIAIVFSLSAPSFSQDANTVAVEKGARWVIGGTFALSDLDPNPTRGDHSYLGAGTEKNRMGTYLPGMTLIFNWGPSDIASRTKRGYLEGVTHSGIPVAVLETEISSGNLFDRVQQDVVVHYGHTACRTTTCDTDLTVGQGMYSIERDDEFVVIKDNEELTAFYTESDFNERERDGYLTRVKDRTHPRLKIFDGYAKAISVGCGGQRNIEPTVVVPKSVWESNPSEWTQNSDAWTLAAMTILNIGTVEPVGETFEGRLHRPIIPADLVLDEAGNPALGENNKPIRKVRNDLAYDFTVVAYQDSDSDTDDFRYAVLAQHVKCAVSEGSGSATMRYVERALLSYDASDRDEGLEPLRFLEQTELPRQFDDFDDQQNLRVKQLVPRVFFYSINDSATYGRYFRRIADLVQEPSAVANIIARLNASCSNKKRKTCLTEIGRAN